MNARTGCSLQKGEQEVPLPYNSTRAFTTAQTDKNHSTVNPYIIAPPPAPNTYTFPSLSGHTKSQHILQP